MKSLKGVIPNRPCERLAIISELTIIGKVCIAFTWGKKIEKKCACRRLESKQSNCYSIHTYIHT